MQGCMASPLVLYFTTLDLVAVSIASDIVPITGENRVMAQFWTEQLNESPRYRTERDNPRIGSKQSPFN